MYFNRSKRTSQIYVKYIWRDFVTNSTLHGLRFVFEKRPIRQRLFWFLLMAIMLGFFAWQTSMLVLAYLKFKVTSKVKLISERQSVFPAVTICNFNKYRKSALNGSNFREIVKHMNPLNGESRGSIDWEKYSDINSVNMTELVSSIGHKMKYDKKTKRGMLYRCRWKDQPCSDSNFTRILTDMGVCYTFNSGEKGQILNISSPGDSFGLKLTMSVEQEEYIGTSSAGLKMRVHDQDEPPLVSNLGFALMPGSHAFAAISKTRFVSLKHPYETKCEDKNFLNAKEYTRAACYNTCREKFVMKNCSCRAYYMRDTRFPICSVEKYYRCVIQREEEFASLPFDDCDCPEPCDVLNYIAYLSYATFPSFTSNKLYSNSSKTEFLKFRRNLVAVNIYYEELHYTVIEQVPDFGLESLLGSLGGLLALFVGASILTLSEFVDLFLTSVLARMGIYKLCSH